MMAKNMKKNKHKKKEPRNRTELIDRRGPFLIPTHLSHYSSKQIKAKLIDDAWLIRVFVSHTERFFIPCD